MSGRRIYRGFRGKRYAEPRNEHHFQRSHQSSHHRPDQTHSNSRKSLLGTPDNLPEIKHYPLLSDPPIRHRHGSREESRSGRVIPPTSHGPHYSERENVQSHTKVLLPTPTEIVEEELEPDLSNHGSAYFTGIQSQSNQLEIPSSDHEHEFYRVEDEQSHSEREHFNQSEYENYPLEGEHYNQSESKHYNHSKSEHFPSRSEHFPSRSEHFPSRSEHFHSKSEHFQSRTKHVRLDREHHSQPEPEPYHHSESKHSHHSKHKHHPVDASARSGYRKTAAPRSRGREDHHFPRPNSRYSINRKQSGLLPDPHHITTNYKPESIVPTDVPHPSHEFSDSHSSDNYDSKPVLSKAKRKHGPLLPTPPVEPVPPLDESVIMSPANYSTPSTSHIDPSDSYQESDYYDSSFPVQTAPKPHHRAAESINYDAKGDIPHHKPPFVHNQPDKPAGKKIVEIHEDVDDYVEEQNVPFETGIMNLNHPRWVNSTSNEPKETEQSKDIVNTGNTSMTLSRESIMEHLQSDNISALLQNDTINSMLEKDDGNANVEQMMEQLNLRLELIKVLEGMQQTMDTLNEKVKKSSKARASKGKKTKLETPVLCDNKVSSTEYQITPSESRSTTSSVPSNECCPDSTEGIIDSDKIKLEPPGGQLSSHDKGSVSSSTIRLEAEGLVDRNEESASSNVKQSDHQEEVPAVHSQEDDDESNETDETRITLPDIKLPEIKVPPDSTQESSKTPKFSVNTGAGSQALNVNQPASTMSHAQNSNFGGMVHTEYKTYREWRLAKQRMNEQLNAYNKSLNKSVDNKPASENKTSDLSDKPKVIDNTNGSDDIDIKNQEPGSSSGSFHNRQVESGNRCNIPPKRHSVENDQVVTKSNTLGNESKVTLNNPKQSPVSTKLTNPSDSDTLKSPDCQDKRLPSHGHDIIKSENIKSENMIKSENIEIKKEKSDKEEGKSLFRQNDESISSHMLDKQQTDNSDKEKHNDHEKRHKDDRNKHRSENKHHKGDHDKHRRDEPDKHHRSDRDKHGKDNRDKHHRSDSDKRRSEERDNQRRDERDKQRKDHRSSHERDRHRKDDHNRHRKDDHSKHRNDDRDKDRKEYRDKHGKYDHDKHKKSEHDKHRKSEHDRHRKEDDDKHRKEGPDKHKKSSHGDKHDNDKQSGDENVKNKNSEKNSPQNADFPQESTCVENDYSSELDKSENLFSKFGANIMQEHEENKVSTSQRDNVQYDHSISLGKKTLKIVLVDIMKDKNALKKVNCSNLTIQKHSAPTFSFESKLVSKELQSRKDSDMEKLPSEKESVSKKLPSEKESISKKLPSEKEAVPKTKTSERQSLFDNLSAERSLVSKSSHSEKLLISKKISTERDNIFEKLNESNYSSSSSLDSKSLTSKTKTLKKPHLVNKPSSAQDSNTKKPENDKEFSSSDDDSDELYAKINSILYNDKKKKLKPISLLNSCKPKQSEHPLKHTKEKSTSYSNSEPKKEKSASDSKSVPKKEKSASYSKSEPKKEKSASDSKSVSKNEKSASYSKSEPKKEKSGSDSKSEPKKEKSVSDSKSEPKKEKSVSDTKSEPKKEKSASDSKSEPKKAKSVSDFNSEPEEKMKVAVDQTMKKKSGSVKYLRRVNKVLYWRSYALKPVRVRLKRLSADGIRKMKLDVKNDGLKAKETKSVLKDLPYVCNVKSSKTYPALQVGKSLFDTNDQAIGKTKTSESIVPASSTRESDCENSVFKDISSNEKPVLKRCNSKEIEDEVRSENSGKYKRINMPIPSASETSESEFERTVLVSQRARVSPVISEDYASEELEGSLGSDDGLDNLEDLDLLEDEEDNQSEPDVPEDVNLSRDRGHDNVERISDNGNIVVRADSDNAAVKADNMKIPDKAVSENVAVNADDADIQIKCDIAGNSVEADNDTIVVKADNVKNQMEAENDGNPIKADSNKIEVKAVDGDEVIKKDFVSISMSSKDFNITSVVSETWSAPNKSVEPDTCVVSVNFDEVDEDIKEASTSKAPNDETCSSAGKKFVSRKRDYSSDSSDDEHFVSKRISPMGYLKGTKTTSNSQDLGNSSNGNGSYEKKFKSKSNKSRNLICSRYGSFPQFDGHSDPIDAESPGDEGDVEDSSDDEISSSSSQDLFFDIDKGSKLISSPVKSRQPQRLNKCINLSTVDIKQRSNDNLDPSQLPERDVTNKTVKTKSQKVEADDSTENESGTSTEKEDENDIKEEPAWLVNGYTQEPDTIFLSDDDEMVMSFSQPVINISDEDSTDFEIPVVDNVKKVKKEPLDVNLDNFFTGDSFSDNSSVDDWSDKGSDFEPENHFQNFRKISKSNIMKTFDKNDSNTTSDEILCLKVKNEKHNDSLVNTTSGDETGMLSNEKSTTHRQNAKNLPARFTDEKSDNEIDISSDDDQFLASCAFNIERKHSFSTTSGPRSSSQKMVDKNKESDEQFQKKGHGYETNENELDEMEQYMQSTQIGSEICKKMPSNSASAFGFVSEHFSDISESDSKPVELIASDDSDITILDLSNDTFTDETQIDRNPSRRNSRESLNNSDSNENVFNMLTQLDKDDDTSRKSDGLSHAMIEDISDASESAYDKPTQVRNEHPFDADISDIEGTYKNNETENLYNVQTQVDKSFSKFEDISDSDQTEGGNGIDAYAVPTLSDNIDPHKTDNISTVFEDVTEEEEITDDNCEPEVYEDPQLANYFGETQVDRHAHMRHAKSVLNMKFVKFSDVSDASNEDVYDKATYGDDNNNSDDSNDVTVIEDDSLPSISDHNSPDNLDNNDHNDSIDSFIIKIDNFLQDSPAQSKHDGKAVKKKNNVSNIGEDLDDPYQCATQVGNPEYCSSVSVKQCDKKSLDNNFKYKNDTNTDKSAFIADTQLDEISNKEDIFAAATQVQEVISDDSTDDYIAQTQDDAIDSVHKKEALLTAATQVDRIDHGDDYNNEYMAATQIDRNGIVTDTSDFDVVGLNKVSKDGENEVIEFNDSSELDITVGNVFERILKDTMPMNCDLMSKTTKTVPERINLKVQPTIKSVLKRPNSAKDTRAVSFDLNEGASVPKKARYVETASRRILPTVAQRLKSIKEKRNSGTIITKSPKPTASTSTFRSDSNSDIEVRDASNKDMWLSKRVPHTNTVQANSRVSHVGKRKRQGSQDSILAAKVAAAKLQVRERAMHTVSQPEAISKRSRKSRETLPDCDDVTLPSNSQIIGQGLPILNPVGILQKGGTSSSSHTSTREVTVTVSSTSVTTITVTMSSSMSKHLPSVSHSSSATTKVSDSHSSKKHESKKDIDDKCNRKVTQSKEIDKNEKVTQRKNTDKNSQESGHGYSSKHAGKSDRNDLPSTSKTSSSKTERDKENSKSHHRKHEGKTSTTSKTSSHSDSKKPTSTSKCISTTNSTISTTSTTVSKFSQSSLMPSNNNSLTAKSDTKTSTVHSVHSSKSSTSRSSTSSSHSKSTEDSIPSVSTSFGDKSKKYCIPSMSMLSGTKNDQNPSTSSLGNKSSRDQSKKVSTPSTSSRDKSYKDSIASTSVSSQDKYKKSSNTSTSSWGKSKRDLTIRSSSNLATAVSSSSGKTAAAVTLTTSVCSSSTVSLTTMSRSDVKTSSSTVRLTSSTHVQSSVLLQKKSHYCGNNVNIGSNSHQGPVASTSTSRQPFHPIQSNAQVNYEAQPSNTKSNHLQLNWHEFLAVMLKWNPIWFEEKEKMEKTNNKAPTPPITDGLFGKSNNSLFPLLTTYQDYQEYSEKFMLPLLLHETWESCYSSWRQNKEKRQVHSHEVCFSGTERHRGSSRLTIYTLYGIISEQDRRARRYINERELVKLVVPGTDIVSENKKHPIKRYLTGYVDSVVIQPHVDRIVSHFKVLRKSKRTMEGYHSIKIIVTVRKRAFEPSSTEIINVHSMSPIVNTHRQFIGLSSLPYSPLCQSILQPSSNLVFCDKAPPMVQTDENKSYNKSQSMAINTASKICRLSPEMPRVCLIQGPPGTGKSHTIVGIIIQILKDSKGPCRICLCAQSNAAVDELLKRLCRYMNSSKNKMNMVRIGKPSSVHKDIKELCLDNLIERNINRARKEQVMKDLPKSLANEVKSLKHQISVVKKEIETASEFKKHKLCIDLKQKEKELTHLESKYQVPRNTPVSTQEESKTRRDILLKANIVAGTLSGMGSSILHNCFHGIKQAFQVAIIDEATQAIELETLIPLQYGVSKLILVGDPEQLPPTVVSQVASEHKFDMSLFKRFDNYFEYSTSNVPNPVITLNTQYRMHPDIAAFPNLYIYDGKISNDENILERRKLHLSPYILFDINEGMEQFSQGSRSMCNILEAKFTVELCSFIVSKASQPPRSIGVIAPYSKQKFEVQKMLQTKSLNEVEVSTVDGFQGREKNIIVMTCVRANMSGSVGFVGNRNRMNVSLTRAKYAMYLVGHLDSLESSDEWKNLIEDARTREKVIQVDRQNFADSLRKVITM